MFRLHYLLPLGAKTVVQKAGIFSFSVDYSKAFAILSTKFKDTILCLLKIGNHPQLNDIFPSISMAFGSGPHNVEYVDYYFFVLPSTVKYDYNIL